jgi:hypothetical protein
MREQTDWLQHCCSTKSTETDFQIGAVFKRCWGLPLLEAWERRFVMTCEASLGRAMGQ